MGSTPPTGGDQRGGASQIPASLRFIEKVQFRKGEVTTFFETYPLPAWVFHEETFSFLAVNSAAVRHYGYTEEEFLRLTIKDIRPNEAEDLLEKPDPSISGFVRAGVWRHSKKHGRWVDGEVAWASLMVDGQPCRLVVVMDVTERRWAEELLKNINAETERRLEARTSELQVSAAETEAFVDAVAESPQSPLRRIQTYSETLARELQSSGQRELNQQIAEAAGKAAELALNLLRLSRLTYDALNLQSVNLSMLVAGIVQKLREGEPNRQLSMEIAPNIVAPADPVLIQVVLENLLENAWKFTRQNPNARVEFNAQAEQGELICVIRDNGVGFDPGVPERLFEPYQRFHSEFEGLGLGLSIVKRIIAKHAGRAWVDAQPGQGAAFCFSLPLISDSGFGT